MKLNDFERIAKATIRDIASQRLGEIARHHESLMDIFYPDRDKSPLPPPRPLTKRQKKLAIQESCNHHFSRQRGRFRCIACGKTASGEYVEGFEDGVANSADW